MLFETAIVRLIRAGNPKDAALKLRAKISSGYGGVRARNLLAVCKAEMGDLKGAASTLSDILDSKPRDIRSLNNFGNLSLKRSDPKQALEFYKKALAVDVWALEPRYNICFAYLELGLAEQALSGLREYLIIKRILFWSKLLFIVSLLGLIAMAAYLKFAG